MAVIVRNIPDISILRVAGLILTAFGGISSLGILFTPFGCTIVGSIGLLICGFIFIAGIVILVTSLLQK
ncbi:hypothetical protein ACFLUF_01005 [Chloroflexota bacterium]